MVPDDAEPEGEWLNENEAIGGVLSDAATTGPVGGWQAEATPIAMQASAAEATLGVDVDPRISHLHCIV
jgi:hypothetical protein